MEKKPLNTCPFDAVIQAIATGYIDSNAYADYVNVSRNSVLQLSKYLVQNGANSSLYTQRATIPESSGQKFKLMVWTNRIRLPVQR